MDRVAVGFLKWGSVGCSRSVQSHWHTQCVVSPCDLICRSHICFCFFKVSLCSLLPSSSLCSECFCRCCRADLVRRHSNVLALSGCFWWWWWCVFLLSSSVAGLPSLQGKYYSSSVRLLETMMMQFIICVKLVTEIASYEQMLARVNNDCEEERGP